MTKFALLKAIREFVRESPGDGADLIRAIADGMADFAEAQKNARGQIATNALLSFMAMTPNARKLGVPGMIDAAFYQFPNGPKNHAPVELGFWHDFIQGARQMRDDDVDNLNAWLDIKGPNFVEWWRAYVASVL